MTWAQGTFAFCFGILAPLVGLLNAWRLKRDGKSFWKGFFVAVGSVFITLVASSIVAKIVFPAYPSEDISEPVAIIFTIPAVLVAMFVFSRKSSMPKLKQFRSVGTIIILLSYLGLIGLAYTWFTWPFRQALPWSAQEIREFEWTDGFLPDYQYFLRAKMSEEDFGQYVKRFELTLHIPSRKYSELKDPWLSWGAPFVEKEWWAPSSSLKNTYVNEGNDTWTLAKYENGYLYLFSLNH